MPSAIEHFRLGDGSMLAIHAKEQCKSPCAFHSPLPGPWEDWPISFKATPFTNGDQIALRACPHGWSHPAVEQFAYWAERGLDHLAQHLCCGCPCVPDGVLPPELRQVLDAGPMPMPQNPVPPVQEDVPEDDPIIDIPALGIETKSWFGDHKVKKSVMVAALNSDGFSRDRKTRAQQILFAWEAKQLLPRAPVQSIEPPPTLVLVPQSERDPNKVAESYLKAIKNTIPAKLHEALVLMAAAHPILGIEPRGSSTYAWAVECEQDCSDYFENDSIATDDDRCVTLKLAILGGYVPAEWSIQDNDDED